MNPNIPYPEKPKTGILYYGSQVIMRNAPFRNIQAEINRLVALGYDRRFFHKHYYRGN